MSATSFTLPAFVARIGRRLPPPFVSAHFVAGLEIARLLQWLTPPEALEGRQFAIRVEDLGVRACFTCRSARFRMVGGQAVDLELGATLRDFVALMRAETDADTLFFQRRLRIAGDTELGLIVKNWLDALERPRWLRAVDDSTWQANP